MKDSHANFFIRKIFSPYGTSHVSHAYRLQVVVVVVGGRVRRDAVRV